MEAHLQHFDLMRYEGYDQAIADESGGVVTLAALFKVKNDECVKLLINICWPINVNKLNFLSVDTFHCCSFRLE